MPIERSQLLGITKTVLSELGISGATDIELTYTQKVEKEWRVSFSYEPQGSWAKKVGCFSVDAETGEIIFSAIDRVWKI